MDATLQAEVSATSRDASSHPSTALLAAAFAPLDDMGWIRVTGSDRVRWLNGMVTNSIQKLTPGTGNYSFVLNAQGRILGDLTAFSPADQPGSILIESSRTQIPALLAHLDHYIIMDDVELADLSSERAGILLAGPQAESILGGLDLTVPAATPGILTAVWAGTPVQVIRAYSPLVPRVELWSVPAAVAALSSAILSAGAVAVTAETIAQLRVLEGTPQYGVDIRERDLPQETVPAGAQSRALHFAKGCYLGQEIVERIRSRGNVHRTFSGLELTGTPAVAGAPLEAEGKSVGELTTVAEVLLPDGDGKSFRTVQLALGYVRREALERHLPLEYPGGRATPVSLPYAVS